MIYNNIRKLIINDKINEAVEALVNDDNFDFKNKATLLGSEYNDWKNKDVLGISTSIEERNRIIYDILVLVTETEKIHTSSFKQQKKLEDLVKVEKELSETFTALASLKNKGAIDLFMEWFRKTNSEIYTQVLKEERMLGKVANLNMVLARLNFNQFKEAYNLNAPIAQIQNYIIEKNNEIPQFFNGWIDYNMHKNKEVKALVQLIPEKLKKHKVLLSSMLGGFLGVFIFHVMENYVNTLFENDDTNSITEDIEIDDAD